MLKFTIKLIRSLLVLLGRVFLILAGLVFSSSVSALSAFLSSGATDENSDAHSPTSPTVVDEVTAASAYASGEISADEYVMYMED